MSESGQRAITAWRGSNPLIDYYERDDGESRWEWSLDNYQWFMRKQLGRAALAVQSLAEQGLVDSATASTIPPLLDAVIAAHEHQMDTVSISPELRALVGPLSRVAENGAFAKMVVDVIEMRLSRLFIENWAGRSMAQIGARLALSLAERVRIVDDPKSERELVEVVAYVEDEDSETDETGVPARRLNCISRLLEISTYDSLSELGRAILIEQMGTVFMARTSPFNELEPSLIRRACNYLEALPLAADAFQIELNAWFNLLANAPIVDGWQAVLNDVEVLKNRAIAVVGAVNFTDPNCLDEPIPVSYVAEIVLLVADAYMLLWQPRDASDWLDHVAGTPAYPLIVQPSIGQEIEPVRESLAADEEDFAGSVPVDLLTGLAEGNGWHAAIYLALLSVRPLGRLKGWPGSEVVACLEVAYKIALGKYSFLLMRACYPYIVDLLYSASIFKLPVDSLQDIERLNSIAVKLTLDYGMRKAYSLKSGWAHHVASLA